MHAGEIAHALDRLANTGRVLYIAAHPDDENTGLLAYLANHRHVNAAYLSLTRGGGGQNLIGSEQGALLDLIRTEELLAARKIDGASQFFSRVRDFGYSKSAEETLSIWGHEEALADVVWILRTFRPDVIITRFNEVPPNHGHHIASAILAREAFVAAADPDRFPEQLVDGVTPWQVDRLLYNHSTWRDETIPDDAITVDVGGFDPRLGLGYGEIAAFSRSEHKSQGFGASGKRGELLAHFSWIGGSRPEGDLLQGLELGWGRFGEEGIAVDEALRKARATLDRDHPELALPALLLAQKALDSLPDLPRVRDARRSLEAIAASAAGLFLRATAQQSAVVPGASLEVQLEVVARRPVPFEIQRVQFPGAPPKELQRKIETNRRETVVETVQVPGEAKVSSPYWLQAPPLPGRHVVEEQGLVGAPKGAAALEVVTELVVGGLPLRIVSPVVHTWTDRVYGERVRPVLVVPPATVTPSREAVLFPQGASKQVGIRVRAGRDNVEGKVSLELPKGWRSSPPASLVNLARAGDEITLHFEVTPPGIVDAVAIRPRIEVDGREWSIREDVIDYPHIPVQALLQPASCRLVPLEVEVPKGVVGYLPGAGDSVAEDLGHLGMSVETLDEETIRSGDLGRYASIVLGVRAYNTRPGLRSVHPRLMEYVESGGTVVVQYNTSSRWSPLDVSIGPFPLEIGAGRVTNQEAEMSFVDPAHPILLVPNRITERDFAGWVQERGLYFGSSWDERYQPLFRASDEGEEPLLGSTLVASHGKGRYVYTGLSFFRQLRAGVPGAYRLFINLLAGNTQT